MVEVYWFEQKQTDVPPGHDWLSSREAAKLGELRFAKRRTDWLLGRWTAKKALARYLHLAESTPALSAIELRPSASGAPEALVAGRPAGASVSLSHSAAVAVCAVAPPDVRLGCDVELIEPRTAGFIADYFTGDEQRAVSRAGAADRFHVVTLVWSAKESALKALRVGLRADTRSVDVAYENRAGFAAEFWQLLHARVSGGQVLHGWWRQGGALIKTVVASPPSAQRCLFSVSPHSRF